MLVVNLVLVGGAMMSNSLVAAEAAGGVASLYLKNCSICHGDKGDAQTRTRSGMTPKPRDFTTAEAAIELTRERMIKSVTNGRPGTAMVAHKGRLSEAEIASLVDYVRTNFMRLKAAKQGGVTVAVSLGEKVYTKHCSVCHGDDGNSAYWAQSGLNPPPRDFTSPEAQSDLTRERMIQSVTKGRSGTGMMPFSTRLSAEEITAVVGFIRFKFMGLNPDKDTGAAPMAQISSAKTIAAKHPVPKPATEPQPVPALGMPGAMSSSNTGGHAIIVDITEAMSNKLKADIQWGRDFYMKNCFTCHGVKGEGDGPQAYFNRPRPRDFTSEASRQILNRPRLFDGITKGRVGTVMPAWGKVLTEQEIANLTEFVFKVFIQGKKAQGEGVVEPDKADVPNTSKQSGKKKAS